jgi:hypothetical protein
MNIGYERSAFVDSLGGGSTFGSICTLAVTARLNSHNPDLWLRTVPDGILTGNDPARLGDSQATSDKANVREE